MSPRFAFVALIGISATACAPETQVRAQPSAVPPANAAAPSVPPAVTRPAPALKSGAIVSDRTGAAVGPIQTLAESDRGSMVIIKIDGKLVGVPESSLRLEGERVVSAQTKAEMTAAAGAPNP